MVIKRIGKAAVLCILFLVLAYPVLASRGVQRVKVQGMDGSRQQVELYGESYALLIAASNYTKGWLKLESVPGEMDRLEALLKTKGFHVVRVDDPDGKDLEDAFENFIDDYGYKANNRLLFFYSGHGHTRKDGAKGYLVPVDAPDPNTQDHQFLRKALPMTQVLAWAKDIEAKHVLFLFDSCFSGTIFKQKSRPKPSKYISNLSIQPVRQFITAGSANEPVPARSTFTPAFIDAIQYGIADRNNDNYITGTELGSYLQEEVPLHTNQNPQFGKISDYDLSRGDFLFLAGGGSEELTNDVSSIADSSSPQALRKNYTDPITGMEFVLVKGGCYQMGDTFGDAHSYEKPVHKVCVDSFYMGKYEVTQGEYEKVTGNNPSKFKKGNNYPVEKVSWDDAQLYLQQLNTKSGSRFRLPTEAEWEYAARSRGKKEKYSGNSGFVSDLAWHKKNSTGSTHTVGTKEANGLGLYDMIGNVYEWCSDWYGNDYYRNSPENNPQGPDKGEYRVRRGGGWNSHPGGVYSAYRLWRSPDYRCMTIGFRLAFQASVPSQ